VKERKRGRGRTEGGNYCFKEKSLPLSLPGLKVKGTIKKGKIALCHPTKRG